MRETSCYKVNSPRVIFEHIEGELILVHMDRGSYYSTEGVGADIWALIDAGCSVAAIQEALQTRYSVTADVMAPAVTHFIDQLIQEDLIALEHFPSSVTPTFPSNGSRPFRAPTLNSYTDMKEMLLLDPVHDVEAAGWPVPKPDDFWPQPEAVETGEPEIESPVRRQA